MSADKLDVTERADRITRRRSRMLIIQCLTFVAWQASFFLAGHDDLIAPRSHPIVTVDPANGKRRLFVNPNYTVGIGCVTKAEGDGLLAFLYEHIKSPEFQMRHRWSVGAIAF